MVTNPLAVDPASGKLKVCVLPELLIVKSVPDVPTAKVCDDAVSVFNEVIEFPIPIAVRKSDADNADIVLSAFTLGKVIAEGFVRVKKFPPTVVAPRFVLAAAAVVAPVPP